MKIYTLFFLMLLSCSTTLTQGQSEVKKFENYWVRTNLLELEDLTVAEHKSSVRIWFREHVFELVNDGKPTVTITSYLRNNGNYHLKKAILEDQLSIELLDLLSQNNIFELPQGTKQGIGGFSFVFEIIHEDGYQSFSYWSPSIGDDGNSGKVAALLQHIRQYCNFKKLKQDLINSLPSGKYFDGRSFHVDFIDSNLDNHSSLYQHIAKKLKQELNIDAKTDRDKFPIVRINDCDVFMKDLDKLQLSESVQVQLYNKEEMQKHHLLAPANLRKELVKYEKAVCKTIMGLDYWGSYDDVTAIVAITTQADVQREE